jgi:hypothetical protein
LAGFSSDRYRFLVQSLLQSFAFATSIASGDARQAGNGGKGSPIDPATSSAFT